MPRKKPITAEIVPASQANLVPPRPHEEIEAMIARLVQEHVDEIMVKVDAGHLETDFLRRDDRVELRSRQNLFERRKWSLYFDKFGCRMCHRKGLPYMSTGHCTTCHGLLANRLGQIKREYDRDNPEAAIDRQIDRLTSRFIAAKSLLSDSDVERIRRKHGK